jgi:hypothetical protein
MAATEAESAPTGNPRDHVAVWLSGIKPHLDPANRQCSASIWSAPDRFSLLTLDGSSIQTAPDGCRRIVWMIIGMI